MKVWLQACAVFTSYGCVKKGYKNLLETWTQEGPEAQDSSGDLTAQLIAEDLDQGTYIDVINFSWSSDTRIWRYWPQT